jgi:hypothetical protein
MNAKQLMNPRMPSAATMPTIAAGFASKNGSAITQQLRIPTPKKKKGT